MRIRIITMLIAAVLTAKIGTIQYNDHRETWYDLDMSRIVRQTDEVTGLEGMYNVREDGVKCYGQFVIVAADLNVHPRYSFIDTSLGTGVVLDSHTTDSDIIDIATTWRRGKE